MFAMETRAIFGGIGIGLVWGWLIGLLSARIRFRLLNLLWISIASLLLVAEVGWFLGVAGVILTLTAFILSLTSHILWRRQLREQLRSSNEK